MRSLVVAAGAALIWPISASTQTPATQPRCSVRVTVTDGVTRAPLRDAAIGFQANRTEPRFLTNAQGQFRFDNIPCASVTIVATKPGYLPGGVVPTLRTWPSASVVLSPDRPSADVAFVLYPQSSISGRVVDEWGEPVVGTYVRVIAARVVGSRVLLAAGPVTTTDDRGEYSVGALSSGGYYVQAPFVQTSRPDGLPPPDNIQLATPPVRPLRFPGRDAALQVWRYAMPPPSLDGHLRAYAPTLYPSATALADATLITLAKGENRPGLNLTLSAVRTFTVSGTLTGPLDTVARVRLRLLDPALEDVGDGGEVASTLTNDQGRFIFLNVPAGNYVASLSDAVQGYVADMFGPDWTPLLSGGGGFSMMSYPGPPGLQLNFTSTGSGRPSASARFWLDAPVIVQDRDLDDVVLLPRVGAVVTGDVTQTNFTGYVSTGLIHATPVDGGAARTRVGDIGSGPGRFSISGLRPGSYWLTSSSRPAESFVCDGRSVLTTPITIDAATSTVNCSLRLARGPSTIAGTVVSERAGTAPSALAVVAFAASPSQRRAAASHMRFGIAAVNNLGQYSLGDLSPGEYCLAVIESSAADRIHDGAFMESIAAAARRLTLGPAETARHNLVFR